jgi:uncharacterized membrane protein
LISACLAIRKNGRMLQALSSALALILLAITPAIVLAGASSPPGARWLITHVNIVPMTGPRPRS